jgi:hypothetical protein
MNCGTLGEALGTILDYRIHGLADEADSYCGDGCFHLNSTSNSMLIDLVGCCNEPAAAIYLVPRTRRGE